VTRRGSRVVLVVSGSRSLVDTPAAEEWARGVLGDIVSALPEGSAVVAGDARGPDAWALAIAASVPRIIHCVCYALDGSRYVNGEFSNTWARANDQRANDRKTWPLVRNTRMCLDAGVRLREGIIIAAAGFVAPWSKTRGTMHTVNRLRAEGIYAETFVCPREFGPREVPS